MTTYTFSQCAAGYELTLRSRHKSINTILDYKRTYKKLLAYLVDDLTVDRITVRHLEGFLASDPKLSGKTLNNYFIGLSSLWNWCVTEKMVPENILHKMEAPKIETKIIDPFTENDIHAIMRAVGKSKLYQRKGYKPAEHELPARDLNRAIVLTLLDTGVRASELCDLCYGDVDVDAGTLKVLHGKGNKERRTPFSARTAQALWKYLAQRKDIRPTDRLFVTRTGAKMTRTELAKLMIRLGERSGVDDVHAHRFRHTFAIMYLRNGGDPYTLQEILGHSTMEMVKKYLKLAQIDLDTAHRRASPVDNMRL